MPEFPEISEIRGFKRVSMKLLRFFLLFWVLSLDLSAQNTNIAFRSKVTFTGQTVANIWGYTAGGAEYALVGAAQGLVIVDITNPDNPVQIVQIPGPNNLWKEIKTYQHYAYVVSEGGQGVQIVDLSQLPSANLTYHHYIGDGAISGQLNKIHALQVDEAKGFLYLYGTNLFGGAPVVLNLAPDPYNPTYAGKFDQLGYVHDGYANNDTLYGSHIYTGQFAIVDMTNKSAPVLLGTQITPNAFTHNTWLCDDHKTLLTTDEVANSFLAAYDVSDPQNIVFLDKIQSNPGSNSIVHNTYVHDNFAFTSWYNDGITIVDVREPDNLVQVGNYDTYPGSGSGFNGCWGVYPYFPSGTVIASNIKAQGTSNGELFILTPTLERACHLKGVVSNGITGAPLNGVTVEVLGAVPALIEMTDGVGLYKMGQRTSGFYMVRYSKTGYQTVELPVKLKHGVTVTQDVALFPNGNLTVTGNVVRIAPPVPVENATVYFFGDSQVFEAVTDASGNFTLANVQPGYYDIVATSDVINEMAQSMQVLIVQDTAVFLELFQNYKKTVQKTQSVDREGARTSDLKAFPNPFTIGTRLSFESGNAPEGILTVFNAEGKCVENRRVSKATEAECIGETWPAGVYTGVWKGADGIQKTIQLIKTNRTN